MGKECKGLVGRPKVKTAQCMLCPSGLWWNVAAGAQEVVIWRGNGFQLHRIMEPENPETKFPAGANGRNSVVASDVAPVYACGEFGT